MAPYDTVAAAHRKNLMMANLLAGDPAVPEEPSQPMFGLSAAGRGMARGGTLGAIAGGAMGGPLGALAGAAIGAGIQRARMGTPSQGVQAALDKGWDGFSQPPAGGPMPQAAPPASASQEQRFAPVPSYGNSPNRQGENGNLTKPDPWEGMRQTTPGAGSGGLDLGAMRQGWKAIFG